MDTEEKAVTTPAAAPTVTVVEAPKTSIFQLLDADTQNKLRGIQKYVNRNRLALDGSTATLEKVLPNFALTFVLEAIEAKHKQILAYLKEQELKENRELFELLVAKGMPVDQAYAQAYGITKTPAMPPTPRVIAG